MKCTYCGSPLSAGERFCGECGQPVSAPVPATPVPVQAGAPPAPPLANCMNCGSPLVAGDRFCGECGYPVSAPVPGMPPPVGPSPPPAAPPTKTPSAPPSPQPGQFGPPPMEAAPPIAKPRGLRTGLLLLGAASGLGATAVCIVVAAAVVFGNIGGFNPFAAMAGLTSTPTAPPVDADATGTAAAFKATADAMSVVLTQQAQVRPTVTPTERSRLIPIEPNTPNSSWLPGSSLVPRGMPLTFYGEMSNEEVADMYADPDEHLERLEAWGRVSEYWESYVDDGACVLLTGYRRVNIQATLYETVEGAQQAIEWLQSDYSPLVDRLEGNEIGEYGFQAWWDSDNWCEPPASTRIVHIAFRRYNAIGGVRAAAMEGTESDAAMLAVARRLAEAIDDELVARGR